jgi:hypothetical protein
VSGVTLTVGAIDALRVIVLLVGFVTFSALGVSSSTTSPTTPYFSTTIAARLQNRTLAAFGIMI